MTPRGIGLLGAGSALWVLARSFGVEQFQMAALAALTLLGLCALWCWLRPLRLEVDRTVSPAAVWFDGRAEVRLQLRNVGWLPTPPATIEDRVPVALADDSRAPLPPIRRGRRVTVSYDLEGRRRGHHRLGPARLRVGDPFGLTVRTRTLRGSSEVTVYPPIWRLPAGLPLGGSTTARDHGRRRTTATGEELADVREYVRGDDLRAVHWPSTAHRGKLMVRRTGSSDTPAAVLLLDRRADRHLGDGEAASLEAAVSATASAGSHLAMRGRSLLLLDAPIERSARTGSWERSLDHLATVQVGDIDLGGLLQQVGDGVAGDGTLIAVLTVPDAHELRALVRAGRGFSSRAVVIVDAASHTDRGADPEADAAVDALRAAGWRATVLRRGDRLDERWQELLVARRTAAAVRT